MQRYEWEGRERFYLETDTHRIYVDPHDDWFPGYGETEVELALSGTHESTEIIYEAKNSVFNEIKIEDPWKEGKDKKIFISVNRSPYLKCIRCSKSVQSVRKRKDFNEALLCDRCLNACSKDQHCASMTYYEILEDGTKGKVVQN